METARACAKVNLTLHVTGRRPDGYHELDSLIVFADVHDLISAAPSDRLSLEITGPEAGGLAHVPDNLVLRAARALAPKRTAAIKLEKNLPVASGIGGGSADAAAALRALSRLWNCDPPGPSGLAALGADVPVCAFGTPARMRGIGERIAPAPEMPAGLAMVLANPRIAVATAEVFAALETPDNPPMPDIIPALDDFAQLCDWLARQRNDLEAPAARNCPAIPQILDTLRATGPGLARMSGSGATCFGLYEDLASAERAAARVALDHPDWWVRASGLAPAPA